eukprot:CAMPEP_0184500562 /NCGR_PEP_ID=MMETSP0113_2-20130426/45201_1 /TAXON_ID=91329 /ORGANISM="Norrisiella sphaerica, Strain BC52" /LENGTH=143 /DNA_ID=CAMNT_0026888983 /DNA_START=46 /DNA_END=477 /DNA_ORIENTATION=-
MEDLKLSFIADPEDSIIAFENRAKRNLRQRSLDLVSQTISNNAPADTSRAPTDSKATSSNSVLTQALNTALRDCLASGTTTRPIVEGFDPLAQREFAARFADLRAGLNSFLASASREGRQVNADDLRVFLDQLRPGMVHGNTK